jgi:hypothetical protein
MKRAIQVPGFYYFSSEAFGSKQQNEEVLSKLSYYSHFRIILDIIAFEHLSKIFIFRWMLNIMRICFALLEVYPFRAILAFGKRTAFVEIFKK